MKQFKYFYLFIVFLFVCAVVLLVYAQNNNIFWIYKFASIHEIPAMCIKSFIPSL